MSEVTPDLRLPKEALIHIKVYTELRLLQYDPARLSRFRAVRPGPNDVMAQHMKGIIAWMVENLMFTEIRAVYCLLVKADEVSIKQPDYWPMLCNAIKRACDLISYDLTGEFGMMHPNVIRLLQSIDDTAAVIARKVAAERNAEQFAGGCK